jgi:hypothetical protein
MAQAACDVCGRTLLRGERAEVYLSGGTRRSVCELCTSRALHGGWVREGEAPQYDAASSRSDRRRSLFGRRRTRRDNGPPAAEPEPVFEDEPPPEPSAEPRPEPAQPAKPAPRAQPSSPSWPDPVGRAAGRAAGRFGLASREPRHVRAVPTSIEHKISSAVALFNDSEHPRTVAGIGRSLGLPEVSVHPSDANGSVVNLVVSWELCWYRYELDLSDEVPSVRKAGQGYELSELSEIERQNNAAADERGRMHLSG